MVREQLIARTLRVPRVEGEAGDGHVVTRQLDVALLSAGFTCSRALLDHLFELHPAVVRDAGATILGAVRRLVGDHVEHNAYFIDFPANVPDTLDFWSDCIAQALLDPRSAGNVAQQLTTGVVNLLDLPIYGRYQHTYEELLAAHDELVPSAADRVTVLHLGEPLAVESHRLYLQFAGGTVPLSAADLALLGELAELHLDDPQPERVTVRESKAMINRARLAADRPLWVDTHADVLRLACVDVSLAQPARIRPLRRSERRALLAALDAVDPAKLPDVARYAEPFKRLGERLHPHEYGLAEDVFAVARGELEARSLAGRFELALADGRLAEAVALLEHAPGMLARAVDRLVRAGADVGDALRRGAPAVSLRVLLALREHLTNRTTVDPVRVFVNQKGRSWVEPDERAPLPETLVAQLCQILDEAIAARLPRPSALIVDPLASRIAVPLSEKTKPAGIGILPRGSVLPAAERVRFFVYWKERAETTDYDLSALLLDDQFEQVGQVSWTNLEELGVVHSGDIVEAPDGATEFIDVELSRLQASYVVPMVHIYSGEGFDDVEEAFFGFMERHDDQEGRPFEPRTVRAKSDLVGAGRVALPMIFARVEDGWMAGWMHLNLRGHPHFNRVERSHRATSQLVRGIVGRHYLTISYLEGLMGRDPAGPTIYIGLERPEDLPADTVVFTPENLSELLNSV